MPGSISQLSTVGSQKEIAWLKLLSNPTSTGLSGTATEASDAELSPGSGAKIKKVNFLPFPFKIVPRRP